MAGLLSISTNVGMDATELEAPTEKDQAATDGGVKVKTPVVRFKE
jgi:hypothetical protein